MVRPGAGFPVHEAQRVSPNVARAFVFYLFNGCAQGLVLGPAMTAMIYFTAGDSTVDVGIVEGVRGVAALLGGIPAGVVADRVSRAFVLRCAALVALFACAGTVVALFFRSHRVVLLGVALGLWGAAGGASYASLEALFADSVPTGRRARVYAMKWQINIASRGLGPAVAAILFTVVGDHWREWEMRIVILCGIGLSLIPAALLFTLNDKHALGASSEAHERIAEPLTRDKSGVPKSIQAAVTSNGDSERVENEPRSGKHPRREGRDKTMIVSAAATSDDEHTPLLPASNSDAAAQRNRDVSINVTTGSRANRETTADASPRHTTAHRFPARTQHEERDAMKRRLIPVFIAIADIVSGLASGMTVNFFAVFFINEVKLAPVAVSIVWAITPVSTTLLVSFARRAAVCCGRVQVFLAFKAAGISLLIFMALCKQFWRVPQVIVPVFVLRMGLMNSPRFLMKSILMDYVPKEARGRWASVDLVTQFGWSGSAVLGGYLVKEFGWAITFVATACTQATALIPVLALLAIVPRHESNRVVAAE